MCFCLCVCFFTQAGHAACWAYACHLVYVSSVVYIVFLYMLVANNVLSLSKKSRICAEFLSIYRLEALNTVQSKSCINSRSAADELT